MAAISTLTGDLNATGWNSPTAGVISGAQDETITFTAGTGTASLIATALTWDIDESSFSFKISTFPTSGAHSVELRNSGGVQWRLLRTNTGPAWQCRFGGTAVGTNIPDATLQANPFFRFRESGSTMFFEYSPDGSSWTTHTSVASSSAAITALAPRFQISAATVGTWAISNVNGWAMGTTQTAAATPTFTASSAVVGSAVHESLNTLAITSSCAAVAVAVHEAASTLTATAVPVSAGAVVAAAQVTSDLPKDFSDAEWDADTGLGVVVTGTSATMPASSTAPHLLTNGEWQLDSVHARITAPAAGAGVQIAFEDRVAGNSSANQIRWLINNVTLYARKIVASASTTIAQATYDPVAHAFLRMRTVAGTEYWDTSPDGVSWTNFASDATGLDLTHGEIRFQTGAPGASGYGDFVVDSLNAGFIIHSAAATLTATVGFASAGTVTEAVWSTGSSRDNSVAATSVAVAVHEATSSFAASVSLSSTGSVDEAVWTAASASPVTAAFTASLEVVRSASSSLAVTSAFTSASTATHDVASTMTATAARSAVVSATHEAVSTTPVTASLASVADKIEAVWDAASSTPVTASFTAQLDVVRDTSAALAVTAARAAIVSPVHEGLAALAVTATRTSAALSDHSAASNLTATVSTDVSSTVSHNASDGLTATFNALALGEKLGGHEAIDATAASAALTSALNVTRPVTSSTAVTVTMTALAAGSRPADAPLAATAATSSAAIASHEATSSLTATASFTATADVVVAGAVLEASAGITINASASSAGSVSRSTLASRSVQATMTAEASVVRAAEAVLQATVLTSAETGRVAVIAAELIVTAALDARTVVVRPDAMSDLEVQVENRSDTVGSGTSPVLVSSGTLGADGITVGSRETSVLVGTRETR